MISLGLQILDVISLLPSLLICVTATEATYVFGTVSQSLNYCKRKDFKWLCKQLHSFLFCQADACLLEIKTTS